MAGYCAASDVAILVQNTLGGQSVFSTSTSPTIRAVRAWITSGCAVLDTHLAGAGYSTPVASTAVAFGMLIRCNALFAAARVEESRTNITLAPKERTRGQTFDEQFGDCAETITAMDLTLAGLSRTTTAQVYAAGISKADKLKHEQDTDRVPPRFIRDQFVFPGTIRPGRTTAS